MSKSADSRQTGYVLAILGVAVALAILIAGASIIAAVDKEVPRELWAIGGALTGALVGILVPPPRSRSADAAQDPRRAAGHALIQSKEATLGAVGEAQQAKRDANLAAESALHRVEIATSTYQLPGNGPPGQSHTGAKTEGADLIANALSGLIDGDGAYTPATPQSMDLPALRKSNESVLRAALCGASAAQDEKVSAARERARTASQKLDEIGVAVVKAADQARKDLEQTSSEVSTQLAEPTHDGDRSTDGLGSCNGVVQLLAAQTEKLHKAQDDVQASNHELGSKEAEADKARIAVYQAAVDATKRVRTETPSDESGKTNLAVLTQPKIVVPATLFIITVLLALLLGLGVIHGRGPCRPLTKEFAGKSACTYYTTFGAQAANVLLSLAAATVGALVGIFAARSGEDGKTTTPARAG